MRTTYDDAVYVCTLDWSATTRAFSITLAILVLVPTAFAVIGVYYRVFSHMCNPIELDDTQKMLLNTDHNFMVGPFG